MVKITQQDIAKKLGISRIAVSYALSGSKEVGEKTRQKVLKTANEMGYRINSAAQTIRTGRFNNLALLLSEDVFYSHLPNELLVGIEITAANANQHLSLARLPDIHLTDAEYVPKILREQSSDGLLINYQFHVPKKMRDLIKSNGIPAVWLNVKQKSDSVYPDEKQGGKMAVEYLLTKGFKRITYLDFSHGQQELSEKHYSAVDRAAGYEEAMQEAGLKPEIIRNPKTSVPRDERLPKIGSILQAKDCPQAFITYSASTSQPLLIAGLKSDLPVGTKAMPVVNFADNPEDFYGTNQPTLITPNREVGKQSVEMLLKGIKKSIYSQTSIAVPYIILED